MLHVLDHMVGHCVFTDIRSLHMFSWHLSNADFGRVAVPVATRYKKYGVACVGKKIIFEVVASTSIYVPLTSVVLLY